MKIQDQIKTSSTKCSKCDCAYKTSDGLKNHLDTVRDENIVGVIKCGQCNFKSCTSKGLMFHNNVLHNGTQQPKMMPKDQTVKTYSSPMHVRSKCDKVSFFKHVFDWPLNF